MGEHRFEIRIGREHRMAGGRDDAVVDLKERLLDERGKFCSLRKAAREDELDGGSAALSLRFRALRSKSGAPRSDSSWPMDLATSTA